MSETVQNLTDELSRLKARHAELLSAASKMIGFDEENGFPVCNCCEMQLDSTGRGHHPECLANKILNPFG
jgi:hypothetical protein